MLRNFVVNLPPIASRLAQVAGVQVDNFEQFQAQLNRAMEAWSEMKEIDLPFVSKLMGYRGGEAMTL